MVVSPFHFYFYTMLEENNRSSFVRTLYNWYDQNERPLPWKEEKSPYLIWLSEIILQQTRVEQGKPYFEKFKKAFPKIEDLAKASEDEVMKLWQGLGYYSRARNLHATAKFIAEKKNGDFPSTYEDIIELKGVGPYTAAAIASFAFNLPHAAVDGNVYRFLSRYFGESTPIDSSQGKKLFFKLANQLIDQTNPGKYNQAIIDFGAVLCKPKNPLCGNCPFSDNCIAYRQNAMERYPVKVKKIKKKERFFNYLVISNKENTILRKREGKDIWQNLFEFPLLETEHLLSEVELLEHPDFTTLFGKHSFRISSGSKPFKHVLTHQNIYAKFWEIEFSFSLEMLNFDGLVVSKKGVFEYAVPRLIDWYLQDKTLYLKL